MKLKILTLIIGLCFMITNSILITWTFLTAYINGLRGLGFDTIVYINHYKEANLELALILISLPLAVYSFFYFILYLKKQNEKITKIYRRF